MLAYIIRRLFLIVPTLLGIMVVNFIVVQAAPGGPVEQVLARLQGTAVEATARISSSGGPEVGTQNQQKSATGASTSKYRGAQGLDPEFIKRIEKQFGFDKPAHERFLTMLGKYFTLRFRRQLLPRQDASSS